MKTPLNNSLLPDSHKDTETRIIITTLIAEKQPLTRRRISELTGLELPTLCRSLFNLTNKIKILHVAAIKPCVITGKCVYHYYFLDSIGGLENE